MEGSVRDLTPLSMTHCSGRDWESISKIPRSVTSWQPDTSRPMRLIAVCARVMMVRSDVSCTPERTAVSRCGHAPTTWASSSSVISRPVFRCRIRCLTRRYSSFEGRRSVILIISSWNGEVPLYIVLKTEIKILEKSIRVQRVAQTVRRTKAKEDYSRFTGCNCR